MKQIKVVLPKNPWGESQWQPRLPLASRDLYPEFMVQTENDVQQVNGLRAEVPLQGR